jgi:hypothetical protein
METNAKGQNGGKIKKDAKGVKGESPKMMS